MELISELTKSQERQVIDHATSRMTYLTRSRRDAAGPDVSVVSMMTSRVVQLPSGDVATVVIDARVAPIAPRRSDASTAASLPIGSSHRVSVLVPTTSNPPVRVAFEADRFVEFEAALADWTNGWSLRPGLTVGMWLSPTMGWVRDESRVYDVIVQTRQDAEVLAAKLYRHVVEQFDQEHALITITTEHSTLNAA